MSRWYSALAMILFWLLASNLPAANDHPYHQCVCVAAPEFFWNFTSGNNKPDIGLLSEPVLNGLPEIRSGGGPAFPEFPLFPTVNPALQLDGKSWIAFDDPGDQSPLDFHSGDSISIEAWVLPESIGDDQQVYVIGKGRTSNSGVAPENQNYALRLRGNSGQAYPGFLFRSAGEHGEFHRWTSDLGFEADGLWHHIAVSFEFGSTQPPKAWVDGVPSGGSWDMGAKTFSNAPVVDNDQLWIGSSMGGNPGNSFRGMVDEIAVFRRPLTDREIQERFHSTRPSASLTEIADHELPGETVVVDIRESVRLNEPWNSDGTRITSQWEQQTAAVTALPRKYLPGGIIGDRTNPSILRMRLRITTAALETQMLIRARSHARLSIDGQIVAELQQASYASDGHEEVPPAPEPLYEHMHPVPAGDQETVVPVSLTPGEHLIQFEAVIGGRNMRVEASETLVAWGTPQTAFYLLSAEQTLPGFLSEASDSETPAGIAGSAVFGMDERSWRLFSEKDARHRKSLEQAERQRQDINVAEFWNQRHKAARALIGLSQASPEPASTSPELTSIAIDQWIEAELKSRSLEPLKTVDDLTFLKRLALNTTGVIPSIDEIRWFMSLPESSRRSDAVSRFLNDERWADHWVPYWQDVLAENPGILKPELNNSGPFRWWIHDSFLDNKPMDRFATELVMMKGSRLGGGPAGFGMATQNDAPLAERALVLAAAFNARDMKCARCHDSPVNAYSQQQLFSMAAMLNRSPMKLPPGSTVPPGPDGERSKLITVSLEPGTSIAPVWPFAINHPDSPQPHAPAPQLIQNPADARELLALRLTHPTQSRFAEVIVNRLWERLFGRGLMPSADRWDEGPQSSPALLTALARQHIADGYNLRKTAALILNTRAWQRETAHDESPLVEAFGALPARRMTAEQIVDSLYLAAGKTFDAEMLTLDPEGRRPDSSFLNLGVPTRAWQFCSLSNERDRPALALPVAQTIYDLLIVYGWRDSRPSSLSQRNQDATVLQPLTLANGTAAHRLTQLNDGGSLTELAVQAPSTEEFIENLFLQILTRTPDQDELRMFTEAVTPGFDQRLIPGAIVPAQPVVRRNQVSWSNHLNSEATRIKQELELAAREGDAPSVRLNSDWRIRAEDVVWVLMNSPEFVFVP
ncbi:MAG: DUF1553 domain-containing protein [Planctomyces sp.]|nr:DUF1553 domain-containing protein [Planctomyces sp.]